VIYEKGNANNSIAELFAILHLMVAELEFFPAVVVGRNGTWRKGISKQRSAKDV